MDLQTPYLVVAGTDTEIGKTTVACALLVALRESGIDVRGVKPVESGTAVQACRSDEDGQRLATAAGQSAPREALQRLKAPVAPPVAALDEGVELDPQGWLEEIRAIGRGASLTLVEGAGGLLSPLAAGFDSRDLAGRLEAPVLVVAADSLGTLNHTLLTLEALHSRGLEVVGVIFSAPEVPDESTGRNAEVIAARFQALPVATLSRVEDAVAGARALMEQGFVGRLLDGLR